MKQPFPVSMRRYEILWGIVFFVVSQFLMGTILSLLFGLFGVEETDVTLNGTYYVVNFLFNALIFRRFLAYSLPVAAEHLLRFFKAIVLGFLLYLGCQMLTGFLAGIISSEFATPNDDTVHAIAEANYNVMWVGAVLLAPMVEETLMRGLIFSNIRRKSRVFAYIFTAIVFAAMHILPFVTTMDVLSIVLNVMAYGLPSIALCAAYEISGTIWAPIALHMIINAIAMTVV